MSQYLLPLSDEAILYKTSSGALERGRIASRINKSNIRIFKMDYINKSFVISIKHLYKITHALDDRILHVPVKQFTTFNLDFELRKRFIKQKGRGNIIHQVGSRLLYRQPKIETTMSIKNVR